MSSNLFCYECKRIPAFKVKITKNYVTLIHKCNNSEINTKFNPQSSWKLNDNEIKCFYCKDKIANKICINCLETLCIECEKTHGGNHIRIDLFELQFYCLKHQKKILNYCIFCQINLCEECNISHFHIKNNMLAEKIEEIKIDIPNLNTKSNENYSLKKLTELFKNDYENLLKVKNISTIEIINNYGMLKEIINYLLKFKIFQSTQLLCFNLSLIDKEENHLCHTLNDFKNHFEILISRIKKGKYNALYQFKYLSQKKYPTLFQNAENYVEILISFFETNLKLNVSFIYHDIEAFQLFITRNNLIKLIEVSLIMKMNIGILKIENNLLFELCHKLLSKVDIQSRRKSSNLITFEIYKNFFDNIGEIKSNNYLNMMSILLLKNQNKNINEDKRKLLFSNIKKSLNISKDYIEKELNNFNDENNDIIDLDESDLIFIEKKDSEEEKKKIIILNLFQIIRKEFMTILNDNIHNKTVNINSFFYNKLKNLYQEKEKEIKESYYSLNNQICENKTIKKIIEDYNIKINTSYSNTPQALDLLFGKEYDFNTFIEEIQNFFEEYEKNNQYQYKDMLYIQQSIKYLYYNKINFEEKKSYFNLNKKDNESKRKNKNKKEKKIIESFIKEIENYKNLNEKIFSLKNKYEQFLIDYFPYFQSNFETKKFSLASFFNNLNDELSKGIENIVFFDENNDDNLEYLLNFKVIYFYFILRQYSYSINLEDFIDMINKFQQKMDLINSINNEHSNLENEENILEKIWQDLKNKNTLIDKSKFIDKYENIIIEYNQNIKKYLNENEPKDYVNDLINILSNKINEIDFSNNDPQNLLVRVYMKQKNLLNEL